MIPNFGSYTPPTPLQLAENMANADAMVAGCTTFFILTVVALFFIGLHYETERLTSAQLKTIVVTRALPALLIICLLTLAMHHKVYISLRSYYQ